MVRSAEIAALLAHTEFNQKEETNGCLRHCRCHDPRYGNIVQLFCPLLIN